MRYFLSQYNRYYAFIMQRDIRLLYGVVLLLHLVLCIVWTLMCYMPMRAEIARQKKMLPHDYVQSYASYKKRVIDLEKYIASLEKQYHTTVCKYSQPDAIMHTLFNVTKKSGIEVEQLIVSHLKNKDSYAVYRVQIDCMAHISQMISFFDTCVMQKLPIRCVRYDSTYKQEPSTRLVLRWYCTIDKKSPSTLEKS